MESNKIVRCTYSISFCFTKILVVKLHFCFLNSYIHTHPFMEVFHLFFSLFWKNTIRIIKQSKIFNSGSQLSHSSLSLLFLHVPLLLLLLTVFSKCRRVLHYADTATKKVNFLWECSAVLSRSKSHLQRKACHSYFNTRTMKKKIHRQSQDLGLLLCYIREGGLVPFHTIGQ